MMQSPFVPVLFCVVIVGLLVAVNYVLVTRQEQREGKMPSWTPEQIDWDAIADEQLQEALTRGNKIEAIKRYRELTGAGLKEAKDAVEYGEKNPELAHDKKKAPRPELDDAPGVRDLLDEGRDDEAVDLYRRFAGVDEYTARAAIERIKQEPSES
jgi:ribosomal protein L7/L12